MYATDFSSPIFFSKQHEQFVGVSAARLFLHMMLIIEIKAQSWKSQTRCDDLCGFHVLLGWKKRTEHVRRSLTGLLNFGTCFLHWMQRIWSLTPSCWVGVGVGAGYFLAESPQKQWNVIWKLELSFSVKCPRPASAAPIRESYGNNPADLLPRGNGGPNKWGAGEIWGFRAWKTNNGFFGTLNWPSMLSSSVRRKRFMEWLWKEKQSSQRVKFSCWGQQTFH